MGTIVSRCQLVRFDPLPAELIESSLTAGGVEEQRARASARLAMGDAVLAGRLSGEEGAALRACAEGLARAALTGDTAERPWLGLLDAAKSAGSEAGERSAEALAGELELLPSKERKKHEREALDARRRGERRARTGTLDLGLRLTELWLRDLLCLTEGADELIYAVDRRAQLEADAQLAAEAGGERLLERAIELVGATRLSLSLNVSEELALESLAYGVRAET
jgi:DNA polymerase-3 subunit delta'